METGNVEIRPQSKVYRLESDADGNISAVNYYDQEGKSVTVQATEYVVACQAIETSRLLLASTGTKHPNGIGNHSGQLGKNLIFSAGGTGQGDFLFEDLSKEEIEAIDRPGLFINRHLQDWYEFEDENFEGPTKGGIIDFLWRHSNGITRANIQKKDDEGNLVWGKELKRKMEGYFKASRHLRFEVFNDWLPNDNCYVTLDPDVKDKWGDPVAKFRIGYHEHDLKVGRYLSKKAVELLKQMGAKNVYYSVSGSPPANLQAGGCRFGKDPETSVLDANCKVHGVDNLYVTDGSFMPTGGSVPYTFTIYANAFRVADVMLKKG
jgi:choline dehydrogenase-like flavoprotein